MFKTAFTLTWKSDVLKYMSKENYDEKALLLV